MGTSLEDRPRYTPTTTFETFPFPFPPGKEPQKDACVITIAQAARELVEKRDAWLNAPGLSDVELKKRTLTNLYNQRPTWLDFAHRKLDDAVCDAYGWVHDLSDDDILAKLLALNLARTKTTDQASDARILEFVVIFTRWFSDWFDGYCLICIGKPKLTIPTSNCIET